MEDDFERLVLGTSHQQSSVPLWAEPSATTAAAPPAFLDDVNVQHPQHSSQSPLFGQADVPSAHSPLCPSQGTHSVAATANVGLSSAEYLQFAGERCEWRLQRKRILGKGSFGCASLYSVAKQSSATCSSTEYDPDALVVVKDINMQTMNNREEEMRNVRTEVEVLRSASNHPNLVQFLDYKESSTDLMAFIVMEFCGGGDLGGLIEKQQQLKQAGATNCYLDESFVASMLIQIVIGLHYLHVDEHILHRDIKPMNIFLLQDEKTARIGDFGVATQLGGFGEKAKVACGSPFYMAPELCEERAYDGAADVWSVGVLLYELMALERPFNASTVPALTQLVCKGKCTPLSERKGLPYSKELKDLVHSMLTVSAAARPTLRRILRTSYVQQHLVDVPAAVLEDGAKFYGTIFGEDAVRAAIQACPNRGISIRDSLGRVSIPKPSFLNEPTHHKDDDQWNKEYEDESFED